MDEEKLYKCECDGVGKWSYRSLLRVAGELILHYATCSRGFQEEIRMLPRR